MFNAAVTAVFFGLIVLVFVVLFSKSLFGLVIINEREVGIIIKKFGPVLPAGRHIALKGEAGYQAATLSPGWHFGYHPWRFSVKKVPVVRIPQGQIGLIVAADGRTPPSSRILGRVVKCNSFQDAEKFLLNGGEKGRQLDILTAGIYRINTALFSVITASNAESYHMTPQQLQVYTIAPDMVGIITTLDGAPIDEGEIAGQTVFDHENFQEPQKFLNNDGRRGLQEQILLSGAWNLNPWFVDVEQVPMTEIPIGHVGIVIAFVGKVHQDVSGTGFRHGNLVEPGHKGVWVTPLYPGKHPLNTRILKIELVPTTNIVLNWARRTEEHSYDTRLAPITVRSQDGFAFNLDVAQIIHIGALDAPKVISRVGAVQNLVDHVLQPIVGNYFRNSAQEYTVLDFLSARSERQAEAASHIRTAISAYDVQAIDTLIGDITPPEKLMVTQTDRKIAEEERKTYEVQQMAQEQRQLLVRATSMADIQHEMVRSEKGVQIAELEAHSMVKKAEGDAKAIKLRSMGESEAIRSKGQAQADAYRAGVEALGGDGYTAVQLMQIIGEKDVRIIPDIAVQSGQGGGNGMVDGLLGMILREQMSKSER